MYKRTLTFFILLICSVGTPAAFAQATPASPRDVQTPKPKPKPDKAPTAMPAPSLPGEEQIHVEPISVKLARGGKVAISSRSGEIIVNGWDRDVVQARANSETGHGPTH